MTNHELLLTLNVIRSIILIASLLGLLIYKRIDRRITICVVSALLVLNLTGLAIATFLVHHAP